MTADTIDTNKLWDLIKDIRFAMFTARHGDGRLDLVFKYVPHQPPAHREIGVAELPGRQLRSEHFGHPVGPADVPAAVWPGIVQPLGETVAESDERV